MQSWRVLVQKYLGEKAPVDSSGRESTLVSQQILPMHSTVTVLQVILDGVTKIIISSHRNTRDSFYHSAFNISSIHMGHVPNEPRFLTSDKSWGRVLMVAKLAIGGV